MPSSVPVVAGLRTRLEGAQKPGHRYRPIVSGAMHVTVTFGKPRRVRSPATTTQMGPALVTPVRRGVQAGTSPL